MPARKASARSYSLANKPSCLSVVSVIFVEGIATNYHKSVFFSNSYYYKLTHGPIRETILLFNFFFCMGLKLSDRESNGFLVLIDSLDLIDMSLSQNTR